MIFTRSAIYRDIILESVEKALSLAKEKGFYFVTAESLTAGLIASSFAEIPGASKVLLAGFVVYTPEAKTAILSINDALIERYGIVSEELAKAMATGALLKATKMIKSKKLISIAVTGIAGPSGGTEKKPVGTVCLASSCFLKDGIIYAESETIYFTGNRNEIRKKTVEKAVQQIIKVLEQF